MQDIGVKLNRDKYPYIPDGLLSLSLGLAIEFGFDHPPVVSPNQSKRSIDTIHPQKLDIPERIR